MMSWKSVNLLDVSKPKQWKNLPSSELLDEGFPVYGANGIIGKYSEYNHEYPTLVITCRGATCGSLHVTKPKSYINSNAMALDELSKDVHLKFLYYALLKRGFNDVITGSAQPQITREGLSKIKIPLPPLSDQIRIAETLSQAESLIAQRKQSLSLLDELLKSTFVEKFIDKKYPLIKLQDITKKITDGEHQKPDYIESGMPFISVKNISQGFLNFSDCKFVSLVDHNKFNKRCNPEYEDIIYTKVGATYGRAVVVNVSNPFSLYVSVALIKPDKSKVNTYFLKAAINHPFVKRQADKAIKGAGVPDLHLIEIKSFKIPLPPMEEQKQFAEVVEKVEALKNQYQQSLTELQNMYGVLSQKAFKGELSLSEKVGLIKSK
jgi:type I restriction enzyme S subunit